MTKNVINHRGTRKKGDENIINLYHEWKKIYNRNTLEQGFMRRSAAFKRKRSQK
jgi:hypothetical protein